MAETVGDALRAAVLQGADRTEAEWLMAHALGLSRSAMLLRHGASPVPLAFNAMLARLIAGEPLAYITGIAYFMGLELAVTPDVLIPRADSETLIIAAQAHFSGRDAGPSRILDLGTGSGALLLAALDIWPKAEGVGVENSIKAIIVAIQNAQRHVNTNIGIIGGGDFVPPPPKPDRGFAKFNSSDWTKRGWSRHLGQFDLILCNPPYIAPDDPDLAADVRDYEPHSALFAGADGLADYKRIIPALPDLLAAEGLAVLEIGHRQADAVQRIASQNGFDAKLHHDLAHRPRAVALVQKR